MKLIVVDNIVCDVVSYFLKAKLKHVAVISEHEHELESCMAARLRKGAAESRKKKSTGVVH